jgi:hypothetical protein
MQNFFFINPLILQDRQGDHSFRVVDEQVPYFPVGKDGQAKLVGNAHLQDFLVKTLTLILGAIFLESRVISEGDFAARSSRTLIRSKEADTPPS